MNMVFDGIPQTTIKFVGSRQQITLVALADAGPTFSDHCYPVPAEFLDPRSREVAPKGTAFSFANRSCPQEFDPRDRRVTIDSEIAKAA